MKIWQFLWKLFMENYSGRTVIVWMSVVYYLWSQYWTVNVWMVHWCMWWANWEFTMLPTKNRCHLWILVLTNDQCCCGWMFTCGAATLCSMMTGTTTGWTIWIVMLHHLVEIIEKTHLWYVLLRICCYVFRIVLSISYFYTVGRFMVECKE
jgi:hypothetical protein